MYELRYNTTFDAAHFLPDYKGKCAKLHGHTWRVEIVIITNKLNKHGMVEDFSSLNSLIQTRFDHDIINETLNNPTAENLAKLIYDSISDCESVEVWESEKASIKYSRRKKC